MTLYCETTFNYVSDTGYAPVRCAVADGRQGVGATFDECGFELIDAPSAVTDWRDAAHVDAVHGPEIHELALARTGCTDVIVYPTLVRSPATAATEADYAPIETVHSDFTDDYGRMLVEDGRPYRVFLDPMLAEQSMTVHDLVAADRIMLLQFWRNFGPAEADRPLAFCDARSVSADRLTRFVLPSYGGMRLDFETFLAQPPAQDNPDNWYTFPNMLPNEAVALRTYDSKRVQSGAPYWTPHSAFVDPNVAQTPEHRRESVEMRALCIWR